MKTKRVAIWGLMLLLALLLAGCGGSSETSNASITITPPAGPTGTHHIINFRGFAPNEAVQLEFRLESTGQAVTFLTGKMGAGGEGRLEIATTADEPPGRYRVIATGENGATAETTMTIE